MSITKASADHAAIERVSTNLAFAIDWLRQGNVFYAAQCIQTAIDASCSIRDHEARERAREWIVFLGSVGLGCQDSRDAYRARYHARLIEKSRFGGDRG